MPFTPEELAEMARADAEIEAGFSMTKEELALSRERDREAALAAMAPERRKLAESQRRYRAANKEKVAESQRRYYAANREKRAESQRRYRAANREKLAESQRRYRAANREKRAESQRRYYAANREKFAEYQRRYRAANKEKVAESKQALRSARRSIGWSQSKVADLFGVTQATISHWENISAPDNWQEIVAIILAAKEKAAAPAGTGTTAVNNNH